MGQYPYPFVSCREHRGPQRAYLVCIHVLVGAPAVLIDFPSAEESGLTLCAACAGEDPDSIDPGIIKTMCEGHYRKRFGLDEVN